MRATIPAAEAFQPLSASTLPAGQEVSPRSSTVPPRAGAGVTPGQRHANLRHHYAGTVRAVAARAHQRLVLRRAEPGAGGHLRPAQHHQLLARRAVHAGRLPGAARADPFRHELLGGAAGGAGCGRRARRAGRAADAAPPVQARPPLRPAADLRPGADRRGHRCATTSASRARPTRCPRRCRAAPTWASCSCRCTAAGWWWPR